MKEFGFTYTGRAWTKPLREGWRIIARGDELRLQRLDGGRWGDVAGREPLPRDMARRATENTFPVIRPRPGAMFGFAGC